MFTLSHGCKRNSDANTRNRTGEMSAADGEISESAKEHINTNLPCARLESEDRGTLVYQVVHPTVTLCHLFNFMDETEESYNLKEFKISNRSLENESLNLDRCQTENAP